MIKFTQKFVSVFCSLLIVGNVCAINVESVYDPKPIDAEQKEITPEEFLSTCSHIRIPCIGYGILKDHVNSNESNGINQYPVRFSRF